MFNNLDRIVARIAKDTELHTTLTSSAEEHFGNRGVVAAINLFPVLPKAGAALAHLTARLEYGIKANKHYYGQIFITLVAEQMYSAVSQEELSAAIAFAVERHRLGLPGSAEFSRRTIAFASPSTEALDRLSFSLDHLRDRLTFGAFAFGKPCEVTVRLLNMLIEPEYQCGVVYGEMDFVNATSRGGQAFTDKLFHVPGEASERKARDFRDKVFAATPTSLN